MRQKVKKTRRSILQAIPLRQHNPHNSRYTPGKGEHAEAFEFGEGEEDITPLNLQIKARICTFLRV